MECRLLSERDGGNEHGLGKRVAMDNVQRQVPGLCEPLIFPRYKCNGNGLSRRMAPPQHEGSFTCSEHLQQAVLRDDGWGWMCQWVRELLSPSADEALHGPPADPHGVMTEPCWRRGLRMREGFCQRVASTPCSLCGIGLGAGRSRRGQGNCPHVPALWWSAPRDLSDSSLRTWGQSRPCSTSLARRMWRAPRHARVLTLFLHRLVVKLLRFFDHIRVAMQYCMQWQLESRMQV